MMSHKLLRTLIAGFMWLCLTAPVQAQEVIPSDVLREKVRTAIFSRDYKGALDLLNRLYGQVVDEHGNPSAALADVLGQMSEVYQHLGQETEALAYRQLSEDMKATVGTHAVEQYRADRMFRQFADRRQSKQSAPDCEFDINSDGSCDYLDIEKFQESLGKCVEDFRAFYEFQADLDGDRCFTENDLELIKEKMNLL